MTSVELYQRFGKTGDKEHNLGIMLDALKTSEADLLVFPEAFLTGYVIRDDHFLQAETAPGPATDVLVEEAKRTGKGILFGMVRRDDASSGHLYNSAVYISPEGDVDWYDKTHPVNFGPFEERQYFAEGDDLPMFELGDLKFGAIICYDIFFPELAKAYAMAGANLVVCISASPSATRKFFEKVMVARAIENTTYFAYCNVVGTQGNLVFWGGNAFIDPRGTTVSKGKYYEEDTIIGKIDDSTLRVSRENRPTIRDTLDSAMSN